MENEFVKIKQIGDRSTLGVLTCEVEVSEKIDGANFSWIVRDQTLIFRSHHTILGGGMEFGEPWREAVQMVVDAHARKPFKEGYIYYGESICKPHRIQYGSERTRLWGFAIYNIKYGIYIKNWHTVFTDHGIPIVPYVILSNPTLDEIKEMVVGDSQIAPGIAKEGVVIKNYLLQKFAKIVAPEFKESAGIKKKPINEPRSVIDETPAIAEMFCTRARVEKRALEYCDENNCALGMEIMPKLIPIVSNDILVEEILNIAEKFTIIDFKKFQKLVAMNCAKHLKHILLDSAE
ncbi:RNA ligase family protein [Bacteroides sp.]|uniref:RNA ligase family protein n=1 Tax=Bacteroides sp. TaxID=29523 RepID=UPI002608B70F|nr:RNA ligase family protein [Bacteroides sp.]MDD3040571.1 RNA ligase family protein [Bacteroides sp.]